MTTQADRPARHRPAPWIRTRLGAARTGALLTVLLALTTALLAAALPRALDRGADEALRDLLHRNGLGATSLIATATANGGPAQAAELDRIAGLLAGKVTDPYRPGPGGPVYGARAVRNRDLGNRELARPDGAAPKLDLMSLHDLAGHARLVDGRWPERATPADPDPGAGGPDGGEGGEIRVQVVLAKAAADTLGARTGTVLEAGLTRDRTALRAEVVGLYEPVDPDGPYWYAFPCAVRACLTQTDGKPPQLYWLTTAVGDTALSGELFAWGDSAPPEDFWRLPIDTGTLRADRLTEAERAVSSLLAGPQATGLATAAGHPELRITSQLPGLLRQSRDRQAAVAPLTVVGPAGVAGVAAVVLCLAAALAADRRTAELRLLRARGASLTGVLGRLLGEGAVTVLPAATAGTLLALWALPTPRWTAAVTAAALVAGTALLALPIRAAALLGRPRRKLPARRLVFELAVLAAAVAAVVAIRRRGVAPSGEGVDLLLVAAPLLCALAGAVLLGRLLPALTGALARRAARRPGAVGFIGLARAARGSDGRSGSPVLPTVALLLAVVTAGFGATVVDSVDGGRLRAARLAVGADAAVYADAPGTPLPEGFAEAAGRLPGVRLGTEVWTELDASVATSDSSLITGVAVVAVDPGAYARLAEQAGYGRPDADRLATTADPAAPLPALVSADLAARLDDRPQNLRLSTYGTVMLVMTGGIERTPALPGVTTRTVVVPRAALAPRLSGKVRPNRWLAVGDVDAARLRELLGAGAAATGAPAGTGGTATGGAGASAGAGTGAGTAALGPEAAGRGFQVRTAAPMAAELGHNPLQRSATRLFWAAVVAAAAFALLAVLLTLVRAAPERAALLARLRTMGLRPRQGLALLLTEALPQAVFAAAFGGLVAATAVPLLGPAVDLTVMVGAPVHTGLRSAGLPVLLQALGLAAVAAVAVLAEAAVSGRRQITTELRAGDNR
ncbi:hypothetical protein [Kitasatospora camelliae]|uniref:ABC transport system permease protein n=1 Tax=Kitasatospora camelliae TaxID=3156397 RepID=A0AAU8JT10_9ACTN